MRWVLLVCLLVSFLAGPVQAQDGLTETYPDEGKGITFKYPAGWIVTEVEGSVILSSAPIQDTNVLAAEPGVIKIGIPGRAFPGSTEDEDSGWTMQQIIEGLGEEDAMFFLAGLYSGAVAASYTFTASSATSFDGEQGTRPGTELLTIEKTAIGDRFAVMVEMALTGSTESRLIIIVLEDCMVVGIGGDENALSAWRDTAMMIVETIRPMEQN